MANINYSGNGFLVQAASTTQGPFNLLGGKYGVTVEATTFGTGGVALQILGPDGATYLNALAAFTANGYAAVDLPPGMVQLSVPTGSAAVFASVIPISNRR
jgi:hypothetical protein